MINCPCGAEHCAAPRKRPTGKWSTAGVPHTGWTCVGFDDLEDVLSVCQMCETQEIRYVHYMRHPNYPGDLGCGCHCAGAMEGDQAAADRREADAKHAARKAKREEEHRSQLAARDAWLAEEKVERAKREAEAERVKARHIAILDEAKSDFAELVKSERRSNVSRGDFLLPGKHLIRVTSMKKVKINKQLLTVSIEDSTSMPPGPCLCMDYEKIGEEGELYLVEVRGRTPYLAKFTPSKPAAY